MAEHPAFSVIIPAYNAAEYIGGAIQSVLDQTFPDFEIVVVNDASPDDTTSIVNGFSDPRLKYLIHETNRGLPATRNTGIRASTGKYIAFLDHDDQFLPEKLALHHAFLEQHPEVGAAYNSRFDVGQTIEEVWFLWPAPKKADLRDLVLGYPFSPSDLVVRRDWLLAIGLLDEQNSFHGEDLNTNCRLWLEGCRFAPIDRALNYRRNHPARYRKNLDASLQNVFRNLELVFSDPRCPQEVAALRPLAYAYNYRVWAYMALAQEETELGREYLRKAIGLNPEMMANDGRDLMDFLMLSCAYDERGPLPQAMETIFSRLPEEAAVVSRQYERALARALVLRAVHDIFWGRQAQGEARLEQAARLDAAADEQFLQTIAFKLMAYKTEFGTDAVVRALEKLRPFLNRLSNGSGNRLSSTYLINHAFEDYQAGSYKHVPRLIFSALKKDASHIKNRGVISMLLRSLASPRS